MFIHPLMWHLNSYGNMSLKPYQNPRYRHRPNKKWVLNMRNFWARPSNHWPENSHIGQVSFLLVKPLKHAKPCSCQWEILSDGKSSFIISHRPHLFCFLKFLFTLVGCLANAQTHDCILLGLSSHIGWTNQIKSNKYWSHQPVLLLVYTYNVLLSNPKTWVTDPTGISLEIGERFGMVNTTMSEHSCWLDYELLWAVSQVPCIFLPASCHVFSRHDACLCFLRMM